MQRTLTAGIATLALLAGTASAFGLAIALPVVQPVPVRVVQAHTVVVGKVTAVEEKPVKAARFKGDAEKGEYQVYTVKVDQAVKGGNGLTHIKVATLIPAVIQPGPRPVDEVPVRPIRPRPPFIQQPPKLEKGQEVILFLQPHFSEPFLLVNSVNDLIDSKAPTYKADLEQVKKTAKILTDPMAALKSKEAADRYLSAALLVMQYRNVPFNPENKPAKQEEVSAEESKLILEGLAAGDFNAPRVGRLDPLQPQQIFYTLEPNKPGWIQPQDFTQVPAAMKKWLTDNAGTFRVKKFVLGESK